MKLSNDEMAEIAAVILEVTQGYVVSPKSSELKETKLTLRDWTNAHEVIQKIERLSDENVCTAYDELVNPEGEFDFLSRGMRLVNEAKRIVETAATTIVIVRGKCPGRYWVAKIGVKHFVFGPRPTMH